MRRHVIPIIILFAFFGGTFLFLLHSTWFFNTLGPKFIEKNYPNVDLVSFKVESQQFKYPETFVLKDVTITMGEYEATKQLTIKELTLYDFLTYLKKRENIKLMVKGLKLTYDQLEINNLNLKALLFFQGPHFTQLSGIFAGYEAAFSSFRVQNFEGQIHGTRHRIQLTDLVADAYGGLMRGQVIMDFKPEINYIFWLEGQNFKPHLLTEVNQPLFSQLNGDLSGAMRLIWGSQQVNLLALNMQFNRGGIIGSGLVKTILGFKGNEGSKGHLKAILSSDGSLAVDQAKMRLQNSGAYRLNLEYSLREEGSGFKLKERQEIGIRQGITNALFPQDD